MSKRKILLAALSICMVAILAVGGTLAYLTDYDQAKNVFTIGKIDIELTEPDSKVKDKNETTLTDKTEIVKNAEGEEVGVNYKNLMSGNKIVKKPTITNTGDNTAYVRVVLTMNNARAINQAIDQVYEQTKDADEVQAIYDAIFDGWCINYNPRPKTNGENDARGIIEAHDDDKVLKVDFVKRVDSVPGQEHYIFGLENQYKSEAEKAASTYEIYGAQSYYANGMADDQIRYVYYMKLDPNESVQLFNGLNIPNDFDQGVAIANGTVNQLAMFDNLTINIEASAIQKDGFQTAWEAFDALAEADPIH